MYLEEHPKKRCEEDNYTRAHFGVRAWQRTEATQAAIELFELAQVIRSGWRGVYGRPEEAPRVELGELARLIVCDTWLNRRGFAEYVVREFQRGRTIAVDHAINVTCQRFARRSRKLARLARVARGVPPHGDGAAHV